MISRTRPDHSNTFQWYGIHQNAALCLSRVCWNVIPDCTIGGGRTLVPFPMKLYPISPSCRKVRDFEGTNWSHIVTG